MERGAVRLTIAPQETVLSGTSLGAGVCRLAVGWETLAQRFRHDVPTPEEIERAIDVVEDEIASVARDFRGSSLLADDAAIGAIAQAVGAPAVGDAVMSVDAVENLFTRMAAGAAGSLARSDALAQGRRFAATLLILRELMHHLQLSSITVARAAA